MHLPIGFFSIPSHASCKSLWRREKEELGDTKLTRVKSLKRNLLMWTCYFTCTLSSSKVIDSPSERSLSDSLKIVSIVKSLPSTSKSLCLTAETIDKKQTRPLLTSLAAFKFNVVCFMPTWAVQTPINLMRRALLKLCLDSELIVQLQMSQSVFPTTETL